MLGDRGTIAALGDGYVAQAAVDAEAHSAANRWSYTPRPADGFGASAAFDPDGPKAEAMQAAYERVRPLVYGVFPSFGEVVERVRSHAALLCSEPSGAATSRVTNGPGETEQAPQG